MSSTPILPVAMPPDTTNPPDIKSAPAGSMTPAIDTGGQAPPSVRNLDRTSLPGGDPNAPAAAPQPGTQAAADLHHSALGEIFQTLAGGKKKEWTVPKDGSAPVATYRDLKPGEMARGILAAAITGLAGGYDPANRGKGPAMAAAFSGGFKANEQRVEKQENKEAGEAQEQFKNEGISQERALRLHQDAREQMKSIEEATNSYQENRLREVQIAMGQHNLDKDTRAEQAIKTKEWENHVNFDTRVVDPTTKKPVDFVDQNALQDFANAHPEISIRHGKYDTAVAQDPVTGHWTLFQKPWDIDRPQWLGVEVKEDGTPKKDAKGEMIIDKERPALDENGKPFLPTSPISERDFRAMNQKAEETQATLEAKRRTAEESAELAQDRKEKREASDSHKLAMDHYNAAGGDLKLTDDRGRLIVTPSDALEIRATLLKNHEDSKATWQTAQKELDNMTDAEKKSDRGTQTKGIADAAQAEMIQSESLATALISPRNPVALLVEKQRKAHTDAVTGKVDLDASAKDMATIPQPLRDEVIANLKKTTAPLAADPTASAAKGYNLQPVTQGVFPKSLVGGPLGKLANKIPGLSADASAKAFNDLDAMNSPAQRVDYINKLNLAPDAKLTLMKAAGTAEKAPAAKMTTVVRPDGAMFQFTDEQLPAAMAAGGVIVPSPSQPQPKQ